MKAIHAIVISALLSLLSGAAIADAELTSTLALTNVAGGKPASQISVDYSGIASRAVDGNTDGIYDDGSVTHTVAAVGAWWEVDLQQSFVIDRITLFNRTDSCCGFRLSNFSVQILDSNRAVVKQFVTSGGASSQITYSAAGSRGRYVRVQLNGNEVLSLAEVQVWADPNAQ